MPSKKEASPRNKSKSTPANSAKGKTGDTVKGRSPSSGKAKTVTLAQESRDSTPATTQGRLAEKKRSAGEKRPVERP